MTAEQCHRIKTKRTQITTLNTHGSTAEAKKKIVFVCISFDRFHISSIIFALSSAFVRYEYTLEARLP